MAKAQTLSVGVLNVVLPAPFHDDTEAYLRLFRRAYEARVVVPMGEERRMMLVFGVVPIFRDEPLRGVSGDVGRFTELDLDAPWYNIESGEVVEAADLDGLSVPEHYKPNMRQSRWIFFPEDHLLVFQSKSPNLSFAPNTARRFFEALFSTPSLREEFGQVSVSVVADRNEVDELLSGRDIRTIEVDISLPNPDDSWETEEKFAEYLKKKKARRYRLRFDSEKDGEGIQPDDELRGLVRIASSNGSATAVVRELDGSRTAIKTADHPLVESAKFDPDSTSLADKMSELARDAIDRVRG